MSLIHLITIWLAILELLICSVVYAQDYSPIGNFNGYAQKMAADDANGILYVAGGFNQVNGVNVQGICKYDGQNVYSISNATLEPLGSTFFTVQDIAVYQGMLYVSSHSIFQFGQIENTPLNSRIFRFNGSAWESVFQEFGYCQSFEVIDDKLYLLGGFSANNSNPFLGVFDGADINYHYFNSSSLDVSDWSGVASCAVKFEESILIGGDFNKISIVGGPTDLLVFNEDNSFDLFVDAPDELDVGFGQVIANMVVWNNKLVVSGNINIGPNAYTAGIGILNNNYWEPIGGMLVVNAGLISGLGLINGLLAIDDHLFIVGGFNAYYGPEELVYWVSHVGYVVEHDFFRLSNDIFVAPSSLQDIVQFNGSIYLCGNFQHINVYPATSVVKFIGANPLSTSLQNTNPNELQLFPNPTTHTLYLSSPDLTPGSFVQIYNISGQLVYEQNLTEQSEQVAIAAANIGPPGMYLVQLHTPGKAMSVQKLVVAE